MSLGDPTVRLVVFALAAGALAGALGSWVVLRRQAFLAHASGATAFAGGSTAAAFALPVLPAALLVAAVTAGIAGRLAARRPATAQVTTGLLLACGLALGVLATRSGQPQTGTSILLGSTLLATDADLLTAAAVGAIAVAAAAILGRWWLLGAVHEQGSAAQAAGAPWPARHADLALLLLTGLAAAAMLPVAGALLAGTLLVVPAATARRFAPHPRQLVGLTTLLATATVLAALVLADRTDLPPGAAAALLAAGVDLLAAAAIAAGRAVRRRPQLEVTAP